MCPACIATAAFITAGVTSAGGVTTFIIKKRRQKNKVQNSFTKSRSKKE